MKLWNESAFVRALVIVSFVAGIIGVFSWFYLSTALDPMVLLAMLSVACMAGAIGLDALAKKNGLYEVQNGKSR